MKNLLIRIRRGCVYGYLYIKTLYRRKFPAKPKDDYDAAWEADEKEKMLELKKKHFFIYLFEKASPLIMYPGFFLFIGDPIIKHFVSTEIYILVRGWEGGAVGLGFISWLTEPSRRKWTFWWRYEATTILRKINDAMEQATIRPIEERRVN